MARNKNKRMSHGGRLGQVQDVDRVAVVNRSNKDVFVKDPEPPHHTVAFLAGNISKSTPQQNCIQPDWSRVSALSFMVQAGDALEPLANQDGKTLLLKAREMGSFQRAYEALRGAKIVDLSASPDQVRARKDLREALMRLGMREHDIPKDAGVNELRKLHGEFLSGRHHLKLVGLQTPEQEEIGGAIRPLDLGAPAQAAADLSEIQMLRGRIDELGGKWEPAHKAPALRAKVQQLETAAEKAGVAVVPALPDLNAEKSQIA